MDTQAFVHWIETMKHQMGFRLDLLPVYVQFPVTVVSLSRCHEIMQELEALKQRALSSPPSRVHRMPMDLCQRHFLLMKEIMDIIDVSTRAALIEKRYLNEETVTWRDVEHGSYCMMCGVQFVQGETAGYPVCGHRFHWRCIVRWLEVQAQCPFCGFEF